MMKYIQLIRPPQWIKNVFVLAALFFGMKLGDAAAVQKALLAFAAFCLASSAGYVFNDILDRKRDSLHPVKCKRPIASGAVTIQSAIILYMVLVTLVISLSVFLPIYFLITVLIYMAMVILYTLIFKQMILLDVIVIATLFVLRALAGAWAIDVEVSLWLVICTFMLCLFLGFGKRRCEIAMIGNASDSANHRKTLAGYTPELLNHLLSTTSAIAVITFLLYTTDQTYPSAIPHKAELAYTLPLVVYGIFRYKMQIETGKATGPTELIFQDPPFLASLLLWGLAVLAILYRHAWLPMA